MIERMFFFWKIRFLYLFQAAPLLYIKDQKDDQGISVSNPTILMQEEKV